MLQESMLTTPPLPELKLEQTVKQCQVAVDDLEKSKHGNLDLLSRVNIKEEECKVLRATLNETIENNQKLEAKLNTIRTEKKQKDSSICRLTSELAKTEPFVKKHDELLSKTHQMTAERQQKIIEIKNLKETLESVQNLCSSVLNPTQEHSHPGTSSTQLVSHPKSVAKASNAIRSPGEITLAQRARDQQQIKVETKSLSANVDGSSSHTRKRSDIKTEQLDEDFDIHCDYLV